MRMLEESDSSVQARVAFGLLHLSGSRRGDVERFQSDRVCIGRGRNNDCTFDPERERSVSHRHCEIRIEDAAPVLYDMGSLNGTYVNGRRVRRVGLQPNDEIGLGREGPRLRFVPGDEVEKVETLGPLESGPEAAPPKPARRRGDEIPRTLRAEDEPEPRRYRTGLLALGLLVLALGGLGAWIIVRQQQQIDALRSGGSPPPPERSVRDSPKRQNPAIPEKGLAKPARKDAPPGLVAIVAGNGGGPALESLGTGVCVAPGRVVVPSEILDLVRRRTEASGRRVSIRAAADPETIVPVQATIDIPPSVKVPFHELGILVVDDSIALPRALLGQIGGRNLRAMSTAGTTTDVTVTRLLDGRGDPIAASDPPVLLRLSGEALESGEPIYAGGDLVAMALGPSYAGLAATSTAIKACIDAANALEPKPLVPR